LGQTRDRAGAVVDDRDLAQLDQRTAVGPHRADRDELALASNANAGTDLGLTGGVGIKPRSRVPTRRLATFVVPGAGHVAATSPPTARSTR
jgi:hypothetical protein